MNRTTFRAAAAVAVLMLAACGKGDAGGQPGDSTAVQTQPAGQQPAPSTQNQAAPQTGPNTPQGNAADFTEPPVENRDVRHQAGPGQTYATCMARANAAGEGEREIIASTCARLPDAPKKQ